MLLNRGLQLFGGGILGRARCVWVGEGEDVLRERQQRPFCVLRIGTHGCEAAARWDLGLPMDRNGDEGVSDVAFAGRVENEMSNAGRKEAD